MHTAIHLSGPAEVLTALPYQLGFHPRDCLVVVSMHGLRIGLVARIDLPTLDHVSQAVVAMIGPLRRDRPGSVLLVGYEERAGESRAMLDAMAGACRADGIEVHDRLVVRAGRWFDVDCVQSCCPPQGLLLPAPSEVPAVAEFVGREICPLPDRSALAALLEPGRPLLSRAVVPLADRGFRLRREATGAGRTKPNTVEIELHRFREHELSVWSQVLCPEDDAQPIQALALQDLATLAVSLTDVDLRDGLIAWLCPGTLPQELVDPALFVQMSRAMPGPGWLCADGTDLEQVLSQRRIERRLCELCAALPDQWAVSTLAVLASFTWWRGEGALTRVALDRALRINPHHRLASLLEQMVNLAVRPQGLSG